MQTENQKFIKVMNRTTGQTRLIPEGNTVLQIGQDEHVVPFSLKDKWMLEKLANLIKWNEINRIKAKLKNLDTWATMMAADLPQFCLAETGQAKYPQGMSYEEQARFRREFSDAINFYGIAIQYLERGKGPEEIQEFMEARHKGHLSKGGVTAAFENHDEELKAVEEALLATV
jgi:hypothetical protein